MLVRLKPRRLLQGFNVELRLTKQGPLDLGGFALIVNGVLLSC